MWFPVRRRCVGAAGLCIPASCASSSEFPDTTCPLGVVWGGPFAYEGFAGVLLPGQRFLLAALGLILGAVLTVAVLWFSLRFAEVTLADEERGAIANDARTTARVVERGRGVKRPRRLSPPPQG